MRLILLLVSALFIHSSCGHASADVNLKNEKEVRTALVSTWEAEHIETGGTRNRVPESMATNVVLKEDGTYTAGVKNGVIKQSGKWSYGAEAQMLTMNIGNENASSRILKLTGKELVISGYTTFNDVITDSTVITYRRL